MKSRLTLVALFISATMMSQDKITKEFNNIAKITMNTSSSDCIIKKSSGDMVIVQVEHYYGNDYDPNIRQEEDGLRIDDKGNNSSGNWSGNKSTKWTLTVPDDIRLKFSTGSGDFMASDVKMEMKIKAGSGDIVLNNMSGELKSTIGSGDVELDGFEGDLQVTTGSGDIEIVDTKGDLSINCGSGEIAMQRVEGTIEANVGSGDIDANDVAVKGNSRFNSGSGDVFVELASSPEANLAVNSGSGDAEVDYNGNAMEGTIIMQANKKNGDIKAPFDFDTTEEIERYNQTTVKKTKKMGGSTLTVNISTGSGTASIDK